jgi:hypothetical protein
LHCCEQECTLGEIADALRAVYGEYKAWYFFVENRNGTIPDFTNEKKVETGSDFFPWWNEVCNLSEKVKYSEIFFRKLFMKIFAHEKLQEIFLLLYF